MLTEQQEEILEAVWVENEKTETSETEIRKRCAVEFSGAELEELIEQGLIVRAEEQLRLSDQGQRLTKPVIRRHRLAEVLVSSILQLKSADMEAVACKVEHSLLPEVEEAICTLLGHPETCPDGKPIPRGKCCKSGQKIIDTKVVNLTELQPGESGKITYIKPVNHENFHQLISFGLHPGEIVTVHRSTPVFCIKFVNTELALDREIARNIFVWKLPAQR